VCERQGWRLEGIRFYTGVPDKREDPNWNQFWAKKLAIMGTRGISTFVRSIRHGVEKGIDVKIALDVVRMARRDELDVALIFSQDQDLAEVVDEVILIAKEHARWIKVACAFPDDPSGKRSRGMNRTDWIRIDKATYDKCLDPTDYRPKR
jgi:hypothetical protein